ATSYPSIVSSLKRICDGRDSNRAILTQSPTRAFMRANFSGELCDESEKRFARSADRVALAFHAGCPRVVERRHRVLLARLRVRVRRAFSLTRARAAGNDAGRRADFRAVTRIAAADFADDGAGRRAAHRAARALSAADGWPGLLRRRLRCDRGIDAG